MPRVSRFSCSCWESPQRAGRPTGRRACNWEAGDTENLGPTLAADMELGGAARVAWIESHFLADQGCSTSEMKAALLALSVQGNANAAIPRKR